MTLREIFERYYLPSLKRTSVLRTLKEYGYTVAHWEQCFGQMNLSEVNDSTISDFKTYLSKQDGKQSGTTMSPNTIRKHLTHLKPLLATASTKGSRHHDGIGVIKKMPKLDPPPELMRDAGDTLTHEEITAWIQAARQITGIISGIPASVWWESLLVLIYNTGMRIGSVMEMKWSWVGNSKIAIKKMPGVKTAYTVYLNSEAATTIENMRQYSLKTEPDDNVFVWDLTPCILWRQADKIQKSAGIPKNRRHKFHSIRKYFGSEIAKKSLAAATKALGHRRPEMTSRYYLCPEQVVKPVIDQIVPISEAMETKFTPPPIADKMPEILEKFYLAGCSSEIVAW